MTERLEKAIVLIGILQLCALLAAALVPILLRWRTELTVLPKLYRQLFWFYGGYVALGIFSLGLICLTNSAALAAGSPLARSVCLYGAVFWALRLSAQATFDAKPYLTTRWVRWIFHVLTVAFAGFTVVYGLAAFLPR